MFVETPERLRLFRVVLTSHQAHLPVLSVKLGKIRTFTHALGVRLGCCELLPSTGIAMCQLVASPHPRECPVLARTCRSDHVAVSSALPPEADILVASAELPLSTKSEPVRNGHYCQNPQHQKFSLGQKQIGAGKGPAPNALENTSPGLLAPNPLPTFKCQCLLFA